MTEMYTTYPDFIDTDPRVHRPDDLGYTISAEMMEKRWQCLLPPQLLKGKSVLDLGSCVGYTGAWALHHGAKSYHGVEFSPDFVNISKRNLTKHFLNHQWTIEESSIEEFFKTDIKFDIVVASGVIYAFTDPIAFLNNLSRYGDTCVIESAHPWARSSRLERNNLIPAEIPNMLRNSTYWETFIENEPFTTLGKRRMIIGTNKETLEYTGCAVSLGYLKAYMNILGFQYDPAANEDLKASVSNLYNKTYRFGARFNRVSPPCASRGFLHSVTEQPHNSKITSWKTNL